MYYTAYGIPDNCKYMSDEQLIDPTNGGTQVDLHSVCYNIRGVMQRDGFGNEYPLTWNPEDDVRHRATVCPTSPASFCKNINEDLQDSFGQGDRLTSCDEFPFASTEEGGRLFGQKRTVFEHQATPTSQLI